MSFKGVTLLGKSGTGKSKASEYIADRFGLVYVSTSQIIGGKIQQSLPEDLKGKDLSREELWDVGKNIVDTYENGSAGLVLDMLMEDTLNAGKAYIIDRMIVPSDVKYLKEQGSFVLAVHLDDETRLERMYSRDEGKDGFTDNIEYNRNRLIEMDSFDKTDLDACRKWIDHTLNTKNMYAQDDSDLINKLANYFS